MEFVRTEVAGVPAFWTPAGDDLRAGLVFRVGRADETLATSGITHMVEHLALYPLGAPTHLHYNGEVDSLTTALLVQGSGAKIVSFFRAVCASLRDLPLGRLEKETQVLRTEAEPRRPAMSDLLLRARYGAATYGLAAYPEFGVGAFSPDQLKDWAARWFTRPNAALWLAGGPPPEGLELDLPDGESMPAPAPTNVLTTAPAYFTAAARGLCCSGVVPRSAASQVYAGLLNSRLIRRIRHDQALSYSPAATYRIRDGQYAHVLAVADAVPEAHSILIPAFLRELERLESAAVDDDELASVAESLHAALDTTAGAVRRVIGAATNELLNRPADSAVSISDSAARWKERVSAVTADDVRAVGGEVFASALLALPRGYEPHHARFTRVLSGSGAVVTGRKIRSVDHPFDPAELIIGPEGVSVIRGETAVTVRYSDCAVLLRWSDGARQLIGRDGTGLHLEPTLWRTTKEAIRQIDGRVAAGSLVAMPYRAEEKVPRPRTRKRARAFATLTMYPLMAVLVGSVPVLTALILLAQADKKAAGLSALVLIPAIVVGVSASRIVRTRLWLTATKEVQTRPEPEPF